MSQSLAIHRMSLDSFDRKSIDQVVDAANLEHLLLDHGHFTGEVSRFISPQLVFDTGIYTQPIIARGSLSSDKVALGFLTSEHGRGYFNGKPFHGREVLLYTESTELNCLLENGTRWTGLHISRSLLEQMGLNCPKTWAGILASDSNLSDEVASTIHNTLSAMANNHENLVEQVLYEETLIAVSSVISSHDNRRSQFRVNNSYRLVSQVQEYIDHHYNQPLKINEICADFNVTIRTLQRSFYKALGISPYRYLSLFRLNMARERLLAADPQVHTITGIAHACGIFHLGRFSQEYHKVFGELPLKTLRK